MRKNIVFALVLGILISFPFVLTATGVSENPAAEKPYIVKIENIRIVAYVGDIIKFPETVKAKMSDGTTRDVKISYNYSLPPTGHYGQYINEAGIVGGYKEYVRLDWLIKNNREAKLELITEKKEPKNIFPGYFLDPPMNSSYEPMDKSRINIINSIMAKEFSKYPKKFLDLNLDTVYVFGNLQTYGNKVGGTTGDSSVFLADYKYNDDLRMNFHHEFSHILYYRFISLFDEKGWRAANNTAFKYGTGGTDALTNGTNKNASLEYSSKYGFVTEYSKSAMEEDIAELSKYLFCGDEKFWSIVDSNGILKAKVRLLVDFYNKLDPAFTMEYFRGLVQR